MLTRAHQARQFAHRKFMEALCPFYRLNRYEGNLPINRADARGAVFVRSKLFYNRIPKNANTTIVSVIRQLEYGGEDDTGMDGAGAKNGIVRPSELRARDIQALEESFFKFVFTRNPYTRVLSAYHEKISGSKPQARKFRRWAARKDSSDDLSFTYFCRYLAEAGLHEDPHWAPQKDCLLLAPAKFDYIGSIENLGTDLSDMLWRAFQHEVAVDVPVTNFTNSSSKTSAYYTRCEIEIVKDLYRDDFEAFGYPTTFPPN